MREFEIALKRRKRGEVIRMKVTKSSAESLLKLISKEIGFDRSQVIQVNEMIGLSDLDELIIELIRIKSLNAYKIEKPFFEIGSFSGLEIFSNYIKDR